MVSRRTKLVEDYYKNKIKNVEILIDNVWDPHNVAAISRTADGLGIEKINLYYTYNKFPDFESVGKKSSSSANKWIRFEKVSDLKSFVSEKKKEGFVFIGADFKESAKNIVNFKFPEKCFIIFGSESNGLSSEISEICDKLFFIPMVGMVESYNVSVAAGIVLYELFRQRGNKLVIKRKDNINLRERSKV